VLEVLTLEQSTSYSRGPFTDSGYASALGALAASRAPPEDSHVDGDEDCTTVYTGGKSIGDFHRRSHVQELAKEIYRQLRLQLDESKQSWELISRDAPTLIKAFAIGVGSFFGTSAGRSVMRFLHKHSR
jgi:hypothetical protein